MILVRCAGGERMASPRFLGVLQFSETLCQAGSAQGWGEGGSRGKGGGEDEGEADGGVSARRCSEGDGVEGWADLTTREEEGGKQPEGRLRGGSEDGLRRDRAWWS